MSAESNVLLNKLRGSGKMDDRDWERLAKHYGPVSEAPLYVDDRTVNSAVTGRTIHCWVFEAREGGAA